ncbi:MAG: glycosyltransferase [Candidatus Zixiibacteriota bacterium]
MEWNKRLVVLYVIGSMGDGRAGTEHNLLTIINHLDRKSFEPILITLQDCQYFRAGKFSCETHCWHVDSMFMPQMFSRRRQLADLMRNKQVDVVQTFFVEAHLVGGGAAKEAGIKAIVSSRRNLGYSYGIKEKMYLKIANRYPLRFLANSRAVVDTIAKLENVEPGRFEVIYNGVELKPALPADRHLPETIVMVANLRPVKAIPTLIRAAERVVRQHSRARFRIIGEGPDRLELQALINSLGLQRNFEMPGSTSDVHSAIANATIGVLTSSSEGFSNSLLEYMRAALPVVATKVGGNDEIVEEGVNGFLVGVEDDATLADRLLKLLGDLNLAGVMGAAGRKIVEDKFSVGAMVSKHEEFYRRLAAGQKA